MCKHVVAQATLPASSENHFSMMPWHAGFTRLSLTFSDDSAVAGNDIDRMFT